MLSWSVAPTTRAPQTDSYFGCAAGPVEDDVYSFGGFFYDGSAYSNEDHIDVHVFNTVALCLTALPPVARKRRRRGERSPEVPSMRYGHTAALIEDNIYIWGGVVNCKTELADNWLYVTGDRVNSLYAFDVDTHRWFMPKVFGTVPEARCAHSACVSGSVMFIHGGWNQLAVSNDIYKLDTATMTWALMNTGGIPPSVSSGHSATIIGTKMFVFGGVGHQDNDIRVFDTETNCWLSTPSAQPPPPSYTHAAFAYNEELYIFGGHNSELNRSFNDLWKFNPKTLAWKKIIGPKGTGPGALQGTSCCCMVGDRIVLFGLSLDLQILCLSPSLKTLCKLAVIRCGLECSELPHNIRWELTAMTAGQISKKRIKTTKK